MAEIHSISPSPSPSPHPTPQRDSWQIPCYGWLISHGFGGRSLWKNIIMSFDTLGNISVLKQIGWWLNITDYVIEHSGVYFGLETNRVVTAHHSVTWNSGLHFSVETNRVVTAYHSVTWDCGIHFSVETNRWWLHAPVNVFWCISDKVTMHL